MKSLVLILVLIPALAQAKKCTNPTNPPVTGGPVTTRRQTTPEVETTPEELETTTPELETTTPEFPPPEFWPKGRYAMVQAGGVCPDFATFKVSSRYQDSEDDRNGNAWPVGEGSGFTGRMKIDGYEMIYCSKVKNNQGKGRWPAGNYCMHQYGKKCPRGFQTGNITWDDENDANLNFRNGNLPSGVYNQDITMMRFCCREDGSANAAIDLPVTVPFFLYRFTSECQKVRRMRVNEELVLFDDEDVDNKNAVGGAHPMTTGNSENHRLHYCHYTGK